MYCHNCGKEIGDSVSCCPYCNVPIGINQNREANIGLKLLSFVFPALGLIFYLCFDMDTPIRSKQCGKCALAGLIVKILLILIFNYFTKLAISQMLSDLFSISY